MKKLFIVLSILTIVGLGAKLATTSETTPEAKSTTIVASEALNTTTPLITPVQANKTIENLSLPDTQTLALIGEVGDNAASLANDIIRLSQGSKPIWLLINSPGGSVIDGASIVAAIQSSKVPVYTVCLQLCASMAFIIHQYGTNRYMLDRAILMAHPASGGVQGTMGQMKSRLDVLTRYVDKMDNFIAKRAGLTLDQFKELTVSEYWVDSEDATNAKFNDKIISVYMEKGSSLLSSSSKVKRFINVESK